MRSTSAKHVGWAALVAAAILAVAGCGGHKASSPPAQPAGSGLRGLVPEPLPQKPPIRLTDTSGRPYDLVAKTRNKLTYLYFGYTHCPDACPATMDELAYALKRQPASVSVPLSTKTDASQPPSR